jgi:hypothetical protein
MVTLQSTCIFDNISKKDADVEDPLVFYFKFTEILLNQYMNENDTCSQIKRRRFI